MSRKKILFLWNGSEPGLPIQNTSCEKVKYAVQLETICFEIIQFE